MGRARTIARRAFLIGSAAVAGGVAFGAYHVARPHENPLTQGLREGAASFNPWVRIDSEGITLITPHHDIGQGVTHMQALLIAEEMDLEPGQFDTAYGPPAPAYYNTAFAAEGADALAAVTPLPAAALTTALSAAIKLMGVQGTGGSTSTADSFDKLRKAGAVARETLKAAASAETGVPVADLRTSAGRVLLPDGSALPYTSLAARAARIDPVTDVTLRDPSEWRMVGKPTLRADVMAKSTGTQTYGIDLEIDGMVHAAVRVNPRRGPLKGFDASAARDLPGVLGVHEVTNGVAVTATGTWHAFRAIAAIDCDWGPSPYPAEQAQHWAALEAGFEPDLLDAVWREDGDVAAAGDTLTAEYRAPYVAHQPLEPLNAIMRVTDDGVEVWTGSQMPRFLQSIVAGITGHDAEDVILHNQTSGGSFGHRLEFENVRLCAEIANGMRGTPVKLTYTREEDFAQDFPRHIALARGRGVVADGRITSVDIDVAAAPVMASQGARAGLPPSGPDSQIVAGIFNAPYGIENFRVRGYAVPGLAPVSSWRSVGASFGGFFLESLVDELIHAAGADPVEERLRFVTDPVARGVLEAVAADAGWDGPSIGEGRGRGVALVESFGVPVAEIVDVTVTDAGVRIDDVWVAVDPGTIVDPVNIENQIQGGVIWGLGHAINSEITYTDGIPQQTNYHDGAGMRMHQAPRVHVRTLSNNPNVRGIGEPPVPPAPPALANAIFAATGRRLREMPFGKFVEFV
ncbi:molybdopterin cofactor-binding domain-containing protein [Sulfitobacter sp. D35]|uniref:xanthine dehydrogenase family protein molybdopterin-binding subunit n=1 Tax=Sulfitobacter sp. D35 TaxID=3083252 RepID=UPI00296EFAC4|nr:molybdopterin cofactor-binding domain-containing protein [Sulfitobacter sp. D35]MDW4497774.1 molybdopterin cofactor-binding domain-containing protein [Sulfitobacter sp. D35]